MMFRDHTHHGHFEVACPECIRLEIENARTEGNNMAVNDILRVLNLKIEGMRKVIANLKKTSEESTSDFDFGPALAELDNMNRGVIYARDHIEECFKL